jgi:SAM-dependent methyltransferase
MMMSQKKQTEDSKNRFTSRVEDYARSRPGYPPALVGDLVQEGRLAAGAVVADVGSGTGILSAMFLDAGCQVRAVEPNLAMRAAGEKELGRRPGFESVAGSAEATTLDAGSVDWIVAGQAWHWFHPERAGKEFRRILRTAGEVLIVWNDRKLTATPFLNGYEALLQEFAIDYNQVNHQNMGEDDIRKFLGGAVVEQRVYPNQQRLNLAGLKARLLSSSYTPGPDHPDRIGMLDRMERLFDLHQEQGEVALLYDTRAWTGRFPTR